MLGELRSRISLAQMEVVSLQANRMMSEFGSNGRVCLVGVPQSGKTTMARKLSERGANVVHVDSLVTENFSRTRNRIIRLMRDTDGWVIEGVAVLWALKEVLRRDDGTVPACDRVIWLPSSRVALSAGQSHMAAGLHTVWKKVEPQLRKKGIPVRVGF